VVPQHYVATTSSAAPTAIQLPTAARSKERPLSRQNLDGLPFSQSGETTSNYHDMVHFVVLLIRTDTCVYTNLLNAILRRESKSAEQSMTLRNNRMRDVKNSPFHGLRCQCAGDLAL
jgi:hypothetical protein